MVPPERDTSARFESEGRLRAFLYDSPVLAFMKDAQGRYVYVNPSMEKAFGFAFADIKGKPDVEWLPPSATETIRTHDAEVLETGKPVESIESAVTADGVLRHFLVVRFPVIDSDGSQLIGGVVMDVTALKQAELQVGERERRYRHLVESAQGLISTHAADGTILSMNPAGLKSLGYTADEVIGRSFRDLLTERGKELFPNYLDRINETGADSGLMFVVDRTGQERTWRYHNVRVIDPEQPPYILGHAQDVTELREAQEHLKTLSLTDELTGLHNRRGFFTMAARMLRAVTKPGQEFTVLYADVDGLKIVNDTYGHDAGSALLVGAADVLKNTFRAADVVARIGGDEFVALAAIPRAGATVIVDRFRAHLANFNARSGLSYQLSLSIGMAHFDPTGPNTLDAVVREADHAMYEEKRAKKNR